MMNTLAAILCLTSSLIVQTGPGRDVLGDQELAAAADPSFDSVSRHFAPMKYPAEVIGVKEGPDEFVLLPDGALQFGGRYAFQRIGTRADGAIEYSDFLSGKAILFEKPRASYAIANAPRLGTKANPCRKRLLSGYLPIVIAEGQWDGLNYEQTCFGWSPGMSADAPLTAFLRLKLVNATGEERTAAVRFQVESPTEKLARPLASWNLRIDPKAERSVFVKLPFADQGRIASEVAQAEFEQCLGEATAAWKAALAKGIAIAAPEQRINDAYRAWLAYNFLDVDKRKNGDYEPHDGAGFYEGVFGYSAALYCHALDLMGYHEEAEKYLDSLQKRPKGNELRFGFGPCDTGALLYAMAEHYRLAGDEKWLRKVAPRMIELSDRIVAWRTKEKASQSTDSLVYGLLKGHPYADYGYDHPSSREAYCYLTDCYLAMGLKDAAEVVAVAGLERDSRRLLQEAEAYRADIVRSMNRAIIDRDGKKLLPMIPETHELLKQGKYRRVDTYYSLIAGMMLETDVLPPDSEPIRTVVRSLQEQQGLFLGVFAHGSGTDHAYSYGYWMNCLERGEPKRAILGLYSSLAHCMTQETFSAGESCYPRTGENHGLMPHLYSNTQQLRLLRNMLIREQSNRLLLGQALPRHWLENGKQTSIQKAPTVFGNVGFKMDSHVGEGKITVEIDPPTRKAPEAIVLHLRHPQHSPIRSVKANGMPVADFAAESVTLKGVSRKTTLEVRYK